MRRSTTPPPPPTLAPSPGLARQVLHAVRIQPQWGLVGASLFLVASLTGAFGALTGWIWGLVVTDLQAGQNPGWLTAALVVSLVIGPLLLSQAFRSYPHWWVEVRLRVRAAVLAGQTAQRRLVRTPPGEVVARTMDADRLARYTDRWVDFVNGLVVASVTALIAGTWLAGAVLLVVMVTSALASTLGRPVAGRSAAAASTARADFGRSLVSALESIRTVKLAAATPQVHQHLRQVDGGRVDAAVREHRVQALLDGVPVVMVQCGVVAAWAGFLHGTWSLAITLLVANAVSGFDWFGRVAGSVVTEAPGVRAWMNATSELAGGGDLMDLPPGMDLVHGTADEPQPGLREPLRTLSLRGLTAVHDDGTIGVQDVDLTVQAGELVLLLGQVGSGKSSLLSSLAGLTSHTGQVLWNGRALAEPEVELRPGRVSHIAQVPRVLSGTFTGNIALDHADRRVEPALATARMERDVAEAGGPEALVGHRGVRLSGGTGAASGPGPGARLRGGPAAGRRRVLGARCRHRDRALGCTALRWGDRHRRDEQGGRAGTGRPRRRPRAGPGRRDRSVVRALPEMGPPRRVTRAGQGTRSRRPRDRGREAAEGGIPPLPRPTLEH